MTLSNPILELAARPPFQDTATAPTVNVVTDGERPKPEPVGPTPDLGYRVALFSDLKRHDMGPALATPTAQAGIAPSVFLTRSLWGLCDTAPFLHDGRATTLDEAILLHGGEAQASRDAYAALDAESRADLRVFLMSLDRAPRVFVP